METTRKRQPRDLPERIDDTPENIAAAVLARPPKKNWDYMEGRTADSDSATD